MRKSRGQKPVRTPQRQFEAFEADNWAAYFRRATKKMERPDAVAWAMKELMGVEERIARLLVALAHGERELSTTAAVRRGVERGYFRDYDGLKSSTPYLGLRAAPATLKSILSRAKPKRKLQK